MLMRLTKAKNRRMKEMPECLPFKSIENVLQFNDASDTEYDEVVSIFVFTIII